jgi:hypothetical protein
MQTADSSPISCSQATIDLTLVGWGSSTVQLNPDLDRTSFGQIPSWNLILIDNVCVDTTQIVN